MITDSALRPKKMGRPPTTAAGNHAAIMDAVYDLLQEGSVRDLTMEAVAKRAGVGKPTLYKWWPSKAALIMAMFQERITMGADAPASIGTVEDTLRATMRRMVAGLNGLFGKVLVDLIAEGQSDPAVLRDLFENHIAARQAADVTSIEQAKQRGEFSSRVDPAILIDMVFGSMIYRRVMGLPLTLEYGDALIDLALHGAHPKD